VTRYLALDKNSDGALSANEYGRFRTVAKDVDRNNDGRINRSEIRNGCEAGILTERDIRG
jgi:hypothetical protein